MTNPKTPSESKVTLTDVVLPSETNFFNNLFGGDLLARMDRACSIAARRHSRSLVVTAAVNNVSFIESVPVGGVFTIEAKVSRAFKTSMEICVDVWAEDRVTGSKTKVNEGIYTFVAVDESGKPIKISPIIPETNLEKERYEKALFRKQLSLINSGRMKASDASEIKELFK